MAGSDQQPVAVKYPDTIAHLYRRGFNFLGTVTRGNWAYGLFEPHPELYPEMLAFENDIKVFRDWHKRVKRGEFNAPLHREQLTTRAA